MKLLDLFCGAGGAAMGYHRAGFDEIVGIDIVPQPHYPFTFVQADALAPPVRLEGFDLIHASPPCQRWADGFVKYRETHPDLISPTRDLLTGLHYVIENVRRAPLRDWIAICGGALGCMTDQLQLHRHRHFEASFPLMGAPCMRPRRLTVSVVGNGTPSGNRATIGRNPTIAEKREAMGIDWMNRDELSQAIPPAYTEFIGRQFLDQLARITDALPTMSHAGSGTTSPTDRSL
jgi:DNA (cytosine-5)-methyltransferase 1